MNVRRIGVLVKANLEGEVTHARKQNGEPFQKVVDSFASGVNKKSV